MKLFNPSPLRGVVFDYIASMGLSSQLHLHSCVQYYTTLSTARYSLNFRRVRTRGQCKHDLLDLGMGTECWVEWIQRDSLVIYVSLSLAKFQNVYLVLASIHRIQPKQNKAETSNHCLFLGMSSPFCPFALPGADAFTMLAAIKWLPFTFGDSVMRGVCSVFFWHCSGYQCSSPTTNLSQIGNRQKMKA